MTPRVPSGACPDQIEGRDLRASGGRRPGLGPVGGAMIELIGASLLAGTGPQVQPPAAIWSRL